MDIEKRLAALIKIAELENKVPLNKGNVFPRTLGMPVDSLKKLQEILLSETGSETEKVTGSIVHEERRLGPFIVNPHIANPDGLYLHIGNPEDIELKEEERSLNHTRTILKNITGTRIEVMEAYLKYLEEERK